MCAWSCCWCNNNNNAAPLEPSGTREARLVPVQTPSSSFLQRNWTYTTADKEQISRFLHKRKSQEALLFLRKKKALKRSLPHHRNVLPAHSSNARTPVGPRSKGLYKETRRALQPATARFPIILKKHPRTFKIGFLQIDCAKSTPV